MIIDIYKLIGKKKQKKKPSIIKRLLKNPDDFRMEVYTEGEEIIIKLKKREA